MAPERLIDVATVVRNEQDALATTEHSLEDLVAHPRAGWLVQDGSDTPLRRDLRDGYLHEHDAGIYDAMTRAIDRSTAEWIWFIHAGDHLPESFDVPELIRTLDRSRADVVYGAALLTSARTNRRRIRLARNPVEILDHGLPANQQATIYRRRALKALVPRPPRFTIAEDYHWAWTLHEAGCSHELTDQVLAVFSTGGVSTQRYFRAARESWRIQRDFGVPRLQRIQSFLTRLVKGTVVRWWW